MLITGYVSETTGSSSLLSIGDPIVTTNNKAARTKSEKLSTITLSEIVSKITLPFRVFAILWVGRPVSKRFLPEHELYGATPSLEPGLSKANTPRCTRCYSGEDVDREETDRLHDPGTAKSDGNGQCRLLAKGTTHGDGKGGRGWTGKQWP